VVPELGVAVAVVAELVELDPWPVPIGAGSPGAAAAGATSAGPTSVASNTVSRAAVRVVRCARRTPDAPSRLSLPTRRHRWTGTSSPSAPRGFREVNSRRATWRGCFPHARISRCAPWEGSTNAQVGTRVIGFGRASPELVATGMPRIVTPTIERSTCALAEDRRGGPGRNLPETQRHSRLAAPAAAPTTWLSQPTTLPLEESPRWMLIP
jgi:hypothetical protein